MTTAWSSMPDPPVVAQAESSVQREVAEVAASQPERPAIVAGARVLTYGELAQAAALVASELVGVSPDPSRPVAVMADSGIEATVGLLGVLFAGRCIVNVDPHLPLARRRAIVDDARPVAAVVGPEHDEVAARTFDGDLPIVRPAQDGAAHGEAVSLGSGGLPIDVAPDAPMWLGYTSGTTGEPKGVVHLHLTDLHMCRAQPYLGLVPADRVGVFFSGAFTGLVGYPFWALLSGAALHPFDLRARSLDEVGTWLRDGATTVLYAVPTVLREALKLVPDGTVLPELRLVYVGGEPLTWDDVALIRRRLGSHVTVVNSSGTTEVGPYCGFVVGPQDGPGSGPVPIGRPLPGKAIELVDAAGRPVPAGVTGRMLVRSRYVSGGYVGELVDPPVRFRSCSRDPRITEVVLPDLAWRDEDGVLWHAGRGDAVVKIAGNRVDLDAVERELRNVPDVADAAVVDVASGTLVAYVTPEGDATIRPEAVRRSLAERVARHEVPASVDVLDHLPRLPSGKVDRRALRDRRVPPSAPGPGAADDGSDATIVAELRGLWSQILGREVGPDDDWFRLGGTSLQAVRLVMAIARRWGVEFPVGVLLESPTVRALARSMCTDGARWPVLVPIQPSGSRPPLFVIHPLFGDVLLFHDLARELGEEQPVYGLRSEALSGGPARWRTVEAMAAGYREAIVSRFPQGPYQLFGQSFGGIVAFELARQLLARGGDVTLVALGDSNNPARRDQRRWLPRALRTGRLLRLRRARAGAGAPPAMKHAVGRLVWSAGEQLRSGRARMAVRRGRPVPLGLRSSYVRWVNLRASARYEPGVLPLEVLLVRSTDHDADPGRGWTPHVGELRVETVEATHGDIVRRPAVRQLGAILSRRLVPTGPGEMHATTERLRT